MTSSEDGVQYSVSQQSEEGEVPPSSPPNALTRHAEAARQQAITALEDLQGKAREFELPEPPETLRRHRDRLRENSFKVLVVGEASRGKSTFVNALIGREVLPVDVTATTSQVFSVRPAQQEAYRLRLEDDSAREIALDDLPRYGSRVLEDAGEKPRLDQIIRWIEVDTPTRFLPENVSVLDTPGVGSLYAAHAEITHRFVPQADAVILVLDSVQPIIKEEIELVEAILEATRNVFFIQTKVAMFDERAWQDIRRRNQEILAETFGERLADARVWPVDSFLLLGAAGEEDEEEAEEDLEESHYEEMEAALRAFLFRVAGWSRTADAILLTEDYYGASRNLLARRHGNLLEESKQKQAQTQRLAVQRKERFQAEWGANGQKRRQLMDDMQKAINVNKYGFLQAISLDGEIAESLNAEIQTLGSVKEINQWGQDVHAKVLAAASGKWTETKRRAESWCARLVGSLLQDTSMIDESLILTEDVLDDQSHFELKITWMQRLNAVRNESLFWGWLNSYLPGAGLIGDVWSLRHLKKVDDEIGKRGKERLRAMVQQDLRDVQQFFQDVDVSTDRYGIVDEYFGALQRSTSEGIQALVAQKTEVARAEIARLEEESKLSEEKRKAKAEQVKRQLAEWDAIGKSIKSVVARLRALDQVRVVPTSIE